MSSHEALTPRRNSTRSNLLILAGFTAALGWCVALLGIVNSPAGAVFLTLPALAATGIVVVATRRRREQARHRGTLSASGKTVWRAQRKSVLILLSFTAVLCWWIAIVGVSTGAGAFFLWLPVMVTVGTVVLSAYSKPRNVSRI